MDWNYLDKFSTLSWKISFSSNVGYEKSVAENATRKAFFAAIRNELLNITTCFTGVCKNLSTFQFLSQTIKYGTIVFYMSLSNGCIEWSDHWWCLKGYILLPIRFQWDVRNFLEIHLIWTIVDDTTRTLVSLFPLFVIINIIIVYYYFWHKSQRDV